MRSFLARNFGMNRTGLKGQSQRGRLRRLGMLVEALELRNLLTAGSVVQTGALVTVTPASNGPNTTMVSYQSVGGVKMLNVNFNGTNYDFSVAQVAFLDYEGAGVGARETFEDSTSLHVVAYGGSGTNLLVAGAGQDELIGGTGVNTLVAGTGVDELVGGSGTNVYDVNGSGSTMILEVGQHNTINTPAGSSGQVVID